MVNIDLDQNAWLGVPCNHTKPHCQSLSIYVNDGRGGHQTTRKLGILRVSQQILNLCSSILPKIKFPHVMRHAEVNDTEVRRIKVLELVAG